MEPENEKLNYITINKRLSEAERLLSQGMAIVKECQTKFIKLANAPEICPPLFVDVNEASRLLAVSPSTIHRMVTRHAIKPYKFASGITRYNRRELEQLPPE